MGKWRKHKRMYRIFRLTIVFAALMLISCGEVQNEYTTDVSYFVFDNSVHIKYSDGYLIFISIKYVFKTCQLELLFKLSKVF